MPLCRENQKVFSDSCRRSYCEKPSYLEITDSEDAENSEETEISRPPTIYQNHTEGLLAPVAVSQGYVVSHNVTMLQVKLWIQVLKLWAAGKRFSSLQHASVAMVTSVSLWKNVGIPLSYFRVEIYQRIVHMWQIDMCIMLRVIRALEPGLSVKCQLLKRYMLPVIDCVREHKLILYFTWENI